MNLMRTVEDVCLPSGILCRENDVCPEWFDQGQFAWMNVGWSESGELYFVNPRQRCKEAEELHLRSRDRPGDETDVNDHANA
jgi:hypothetical protein